MVKRLFTVIILCLAVLSAAAQGIVKVQEDYVRKYAPLAVSEMYRTGVPASITLAQGLLESNAGLSRLAKQGNNHFGIKCHNWTGKKIYHDDDKRGECFRAYDNVAESFRDHSDFLRYQDRYKSLFNNDVTDYRAWAYGLKRAGYATDPAYPSKLINNIERFGLSKYDRMTLAEAAKLADNKEVASNAKEVSAPEEKKKVSTGTVKTAHSKADKRSRRAARKAAKATESAKTRRTAQASANEGKSGIPEAPLALETPVKVSAEKSGTFKFDLTRQVYSQNEVPFVYSVEGETYDSIADEYHLFHKEILKFNDLKSSQPLAPGTMVYLQAKKKSAPRGLEKFIAEEDGTSLRDLSQRYGVKLKFLCKMNGLEESYELKAGDEIKLR